MSEPKAASAVSVARTGRRGPHGGLQRRGPGRRRLPLAPPEYAASYINSQGRKSAGNDTEIGTGGTPFMKYLKKHRDETEANLLAFT
jgi:hypothetical protein